MHVQIWTALNWLFAILNVFRTISVQFISFLLRQCEQALEQRIDRAELTDGWVDRQVVGLTDEFAVVGRQVKQVTCIEPYSTHDAREAAHVIDAILGASDDVIGWNSAAAAVASRPVSAIYAQQKPRFRRCRDVLCGVRLGQLPNLGSWIHRCANRPVTQAGGNWCVARVISGICDFEYVYCVQTGAPHTSQYSAVLPEAHLNQGSFTPDPVWKTSHSNILAYCIARFKWNETDGLRAQPTRGTRSPHPFPETLKKFWHKCARIICSPRPVVE